MLDARAELRTMRNMEQLDAFGPAVEEPTRSTLTCSALCEASRALVAVSRELLNRLEAAERQAVLKFGCDARRADGGDDAGVHVIPPLGPQ
jgi:hypothetical protein